MTAPARSGMVRWLWYLCWGGWTLLFAQQFLDALVLGLPWVIWVGKLLPLLIVLPGMLRDHLRSYIWLCFVTMLYFIALVERVFAVPDSVPAWIGLGAVICLFLGAMFYVRQRARQLRSAAPEGGTS
jgi:uncharacterized membrane protein